MRKVLALLTFAIILSSCSQDIRFSNPALQGDVDGEVWRSSSHEARIVNGSVNITAMRGFEKLEITIGSTAIGQTHTFGLAGNSRAVFTIDAPSNLTVYDTQPANGAGQIIIDEINTTQRYISGEIIFFDAPVATGLRIYGELFNFSRGIFFKIPLRN